MSYFSDEQYKRAKYIVASIIKSGLLKYLPAVATAGMLMGESGLNEKSANKQSSAGGVWQWTGWDGGMYKQLWLDGILPKNCPQNSYGARQFVFTNYDFKQQVEMGIKEQALTTKRSKKHRSNLALFYNRNGNDIIKWAGDMNGWWGHYGGGVEAVLHNESKAGGGVYSNAQIEKAVGMKGKYAKELLNRIEAEGGEKSLPNDVTIGVLGDFSGGGNAGSISVSSACTNVSPIEGGEFKQGLNKNNTQKGLIIGITINQK